VASRFEPHGVGSPLAQFEAYSETVPLGRAAFVELRRTGASAAASLATVNGRKAHFAGHDRAGGHVYGLGVIRPGAHQGCRLTNSPTLPDALQPLGQSLLPQRENRVNPGGSQCWDQACEYGHHNEVRWLAE
jgi:hypothetical protein